MPKPNAIRANMKLVTSLLLLGSIAYSQDMNLMNQEQMQIMMQEMQKMQVCMSKIDMSPLQALEAESSSMEKEIKELCHQGKRDKAQNKAISYANKIMAMPSLVQMKECANNTAMEKMIDFDINDFKGKHVCDDEKIEFGVPSNKRVNW